jgi:peptidyl-prolyl cis-trans isomerase D
LVGGIVSTIIVVFMVEFRAGRGPTAGLKRQCAVEYAGTCLDQKDYFAALGVVAPRGAEASALKRLGIRKKVLDGLVERELLLAQARTLGLGVGEDTIDAELAAGRAHVSLPAAEGAQLSAGLGLCRLDPRSDPRDPQCEAGSERMVRQLRVRRTANEPFDYKLYEKEIRVLANRGPREFKIMQEKELLAARMRELVRSRVRLSAAEAEFVAERAVIRSAQLTRDWFAKYAIDTQRATVDRWAFENREQIDSAWNTEKANWTAGCPIVREVVIPVPAEALEDEKSPSLQKAEDARKRLASGQSFADVAREVSQGPQASLGGELGCLSKSYGIGAEELLKAVEPLKVGEVSKVIETPRGYHVVQVVERVDAAKLEERGRHHLALSLYTHFAAEEAARKFADALIERVKSGQKLEDALREQSQAAVASAKSEKPKASGAKSKDGEGEPAALTDAGRPKFEISAPFGRSGNPLPDVEPREPLAAKAFELGKADALYEKPVETSTGFVVFQLKELTHPDASELVDLRARMLSMKADDALARYVADLRKAAGSKLKVDASFGEDRTKSSDDE